MTLTYIMQMNLEKYTGEDLGLLAGEVSVSRSYVILLTNRRGRDTCLSTYIRVNISRLLILPSLH